MNTFRHALLISLPIAALAMIGGGVWCYSRPAAPIVVGALILFDLYRKDRRP